MSETAAVKPKKPEYTIRLADRFAEIARELAASQGKPFAEILSNACEIGITELVERDNKLNWWQSRERAGKVAALLEGLEPEQLEEAIAYLRQLQEGK